MDDGVDGPTPVPRPPRRTWVQHTWVTFRSLPMWAQVPIGAFFGLFLFFAAFIGVYTLVAPLVEHGDGETETIAAEVTTSAEPSPTTRREGTSAETTTTEPQTTTTANTTSTTSSTTTSTSPTTAAAAAPGKELRISVWDETSSRPADDLEIWSAGHGSWHPDLQFGIDGAESFGVFPVDRPSEFFIYPDGRAGTEIRVQFTMTVEMQSGSDRDMVGIDIYDDRVEVFGTCLPDYELDFPR